MILVTVGTQLPFDRMIRTIDAWAARRTRADVFAQIGPTDYRPQNIEFVPFLDADVCRKLIATCDAVVSHAGMGSILTALEMGKPIVVMPRRAELGEHRNDHQVATVRRLTVHGRIFAAMDEHQLVERLEHLDELTTAARTTAMARPQLLKTLATFVEHGCVEEDANEPMPASLMIDLPGAAPLAARAEMTVPDSMPLAPEPEPAVAIPGVLR